MKEYIIVGAGHFGKEALLYHGIANVAFFCDNNKCGNFIWGIEVIGFPELSRIWKKYRVILAVWAPKARQELARQLEDNGIEYASFHSMRMEDPFWKDSFSGEYTFDNRSKGSEKLLIILAGYKPFLWDSVFDRVKRFSPPDMDICVLTAGYKNEELSRLCEREGWSYLYSEKNQLALVQNLAIWEHANAKWIYKMDEDIFVTQGMFRKLSDTWHVVEEDRKYQPGFVAPLMAVNSYGYRRVLEYMGCLEEYRQKFGDVACYGRGKIFTEQSVAEFLWDKTLPIDAFAEGLKKNRERYSVCCHRFSIGCILLSRDNWEAMRGFENADEGVLGMDEEYLCKWCMNSFKAIIVSERAYAGQFAYGFQTEWMKKMYDERREEFDKKRCDGQWKTY